MTATIFLAVMGAALLHSVWNALVKGGEDKHLGMTAVVLGHIPMALLAIPFATSPDPAAWPYIACGVALHVGYQLFLLRSYQIGDLTHVYPVARGIAPLLVALVSMLFMGVTLNSLEITAILMIATGILSLSLVRRNGPVTPGEGKILFYAIGTGCFIAAYSLVDGVGARVAGSSLGFYICLTIGNAVAMGIYMTVTRPAMMRSLPEKAGRIFILGGGASFGAYAIVLWAFTLAPIALVSAVRETSIIFALLIGVFFLKEKLDLMKLVSTMMTLGGAILLKYSR